MRCLKRWSVCQAAGTYNITLVDVNQWEAKPIKPKNTAQLFWQLVVIIYINPFSALIAFLCDIAYFDYNLWWYTSSWLGPCDNISFEIGPISLVH